MPSYTSSFGTPKFWEKIPLALILLPLFGKKDIAQVVPLLLVELNISWSSAYSGRV